MIKLSAHERRRIERELSKVIPISRQQLLLAACAHAKSEGPALLGMAEAEEKRLLDNRLKLNDSDRQKLERVQIAAARLRKQFTHVVTAGKGRGGRPVEFAAFKMILCRLVGFVRDRMKRTNQLQRTTAEPDANAAAATLLMFWRLDRARYFGEGPEGTPRVAWIARKVFDAQRRPRTGLYAEMKNAGQI